MKYRDSASDPNDLSLRSPTICVAHRDSRVRDGFGLTLRTAGYQVTQSCDTPYTLAALRERSFDLVLVGLTMPDLGGPEGYRRIRQMAARSGIVVLAQRGSEELHALDALAAGADDYLAVPCEPGELLVRVRSVLHRLNPALCAKTLRVGDCEIHLERRIVRVGSRSIHLTRREFDLLVFLMQRAGTPVAHSQLLRAVWGPEYGNELEYLRVYMRLLRKKIEQDPGCPSYIRTEPGVGYYFEDPASRGRRG